MLRTVVASEVNARGLELRDARTFDERVIIHDPAVAQVIHSAAASSRRYGSQTRVRQPGRQGAM